MMQKKEVTFKRRKSAREKGGDAEVSGGAAFDRCRAAVPREWREGQEHRYREVRVLWEGDRMLRWLLFAVKYAVRSSSKRARV